MYLIGSVFKSESFWVIEIPALNVVTQGHTKKDAYFMIRDAVEMLINKKGFKTETVPLNKSEFLFGSNDSGALIAFLLKQQRHKHGLSLSDMAERLGVASKNAYAQYEQGKNLPSLTKLQNFLEAMSEDLILIFNVVEEYVKRVA